MWSLANCRRAAMFFLERSGLLLATPAMHTTVVQCSLYGGLMNISQGERSLQLLRSYPGVLCDLADYYTHCSLSDLCWSTTPGEGNNGLEFPPFVHNLSDCGLGESKLFRDVFVTFSSLMSIINLFFWGPQKSSLFAPWYTSTNMCCEDQTLIGPCSLYKTGCPLIPDCHPIDWKRLTLVSP